MTTLKDCTSAVLTISTAHLPESDHAVLNYERPSAKGTDADVDESLARRCDCLSDYISWDNGIDQGWLIHFRPTSHGCATPLSYDYEARRAIVEDAGMSLAFVELITKAQAEGVRYILLDCYELKCDELPTFNGDTLEEVTT